MKKVAACQGRRWREMAMAKTILKIGFGLMAVGVGTAALLAVMAPKAGQLAHEELETAL
jgi:hypothetical protein